jgi:hypothetical protein
MKECVKELAKHGNFKEVKTLLKKELLPGEKYENKTIRDVVNPNNADDECGVIRDIAKDRGIEHDLADYKKEIERNIKTGTNKIKKTKMIIDNKEITVNLRGECGKCWMCGEVVYYYWHKDNHTSCGDCEHVAGIVPAMLAGMLAWQGLTGIMIQGYKPSHVHCNRYKSYHVPIKFNTDDTQWNTDIDSTDSIVNKISPPTKIHKSEYCPYFKEVYTAAQKTQSKINNYRQTAKENIKATADVLTNSINSTLRLNQGGTSEDKINAWANMISMMLEDYSGEKGSASASDKKEKGSASASDKKEKGSASASEEDYDDDDSEYANTQGTTNSLDDDDSDDSEYANTQGTTNSLDDDDSDDDDSDDDDSEYANTQETTNSLDDDDSDDDDSEYANTQETTNSLDDNSGEKVSAKGSTSDEDEEDSLIMKSKNKNGRRIVVSDSESDSDNSNEKYTGDEKIHTEKDNVADAKEGKERIKAKINAEKQAQINATNLYAKKTTGKSLFSKNNTINGGDGRITRLEELYNFIGKEDIIHIARYTLDLFEQTDLICKDYKLPFYHGFVIAGFIKKNLYSVDSLKEAAAIEKSTGTPIFQTFFEYLNEIKQPNTKINNYYNTHIMDKCPRYREISKRNIISRTHGGIINKPKQKNNNTRKKEKETKLHKYTSKKKSNNTSKKKSNKNSKKKSHKSQ